MPLGFLSWKGILFACAVAGGVAAMAAWRLSTVTAVTANDGSLYDYSVIGLDGQEVPLAVYRGQVALVVNVASACGLAGQYDGLEALYRRYRERGFVVLGFPSNDFWQEPKDEAGIRGVCDTRGVTFPVFARTHVRGDERAPLYQFLAASGEAPMWNFAKYLIGRDGRPRAFFGSLVSPDDGALADAIARALAEAPPVLADR